MSEPLLSEQLLKRGYAAVSRNLVEFGYPDATPEKIAEAHKLWLTGTKAADIIDMFAAKQFELRPDVFGKPPATSEPAQP